MLKMKFVLFKNGKAIMKRKDVHWWLTEFKLGEFSQPFTRIDEFDEISQKKNKLLCDSFNELTRDYDNALDKIIALQEIAPDPTSKSILNR